MNGSYYQNPTFPVDDYEVNNDKSMDYNEQSYIENILRLNKGRIVKAHVSFPDSTEWKNKVFSGTIEQAGKDHLIIKDTQNGYWYLIRLLYLDFVEFDEPINYLYQYSQK